MQIGVNKLQNIGNNISTKFSNPIKSTVSKLGANQVCPNAALGAFAAAASGAYIANKAVQQRDERVSALQKLNLNNEINKKILNAKDNYGNHVFDTERIKLLTEIAEVKDSALFKYIISNLDNITSLEKHKEPSFDIDINTYVTHAKTPNGNTTASITVTDVGTLYKATEYNADGLPVTIERVCDDTIMSEKRNIYFGEKESLIYDKFKQTITTEKYDSANNLKYSKVVALSKDNLIDNVYIRNFEQIDNNNVKVSSNAIDYKNNIKLNIDEVKTPTKYNVEKEIRTYKNPRTGRIETLRMEKSEVPGVYNTTITDDLGNTRTESYGKKDLFGNFTVEKNFESIDGTKTHYTYKSNKDETDVVMHYEIKSSDGTPLTTVDRTFKRVSPELAYSSINGHEYTIKTKDNSVEVTDIFNNEVTDISFDEFFEYEEDKENKTLLNKMSGDMLLDMHKRGYQYSRVDDLYKSGMSAKNKEIEAQDDIFTFAHEQGHTKDIISRQDADYNHEIEKDRPDQNRIVSNPTFIKTFKSERRQLRENFPEIEKEYVSYFTNQLIRGGEETVAEANALFSTGMPNEQGDVTRVYYLQKYFPRTIAVLSTLLNPNSNIYVGK
ncbi:hypothetical protein IJ732_00505 [bacterium]|nr:hypothetical protein [bacterium]